MKRLIWMAVQLKDSDFPFAEHLKRQKNIRQLSAAKEDLNA